MVGTPSIKGSLVMHRSILFSAAAIALVAGSVSAQACGVRPDVKTAVVKLPRIALPAA
jgi:hypothetical protein